MSYVLSSLWIRYSNPFSTSQRYPSCIPLPSASTALSFSPVDTYGLTSAPLHVSTPSSLLTASALAYTRTGLDGRHIDFVQRKTSCITTLSFILGDWTFEHDIDQFSTYSSARAKDPASSQGHRFGTRDRDDGSYWTELRLFLADGVLPVRLIAESDRLAFQRRARRFFLHEGRLWLAPRRSSSAPPRLVVEDTARRGELMLDAHLAAGHRGRDATYKLLLDRFYWPNMYDNVSYFVRSCWECQRAYKAKPILPYSESWQAPLLRHFDLDTIHMPTGVGGFEYVIQAIERTVLWVEARALRNATARAVARFIYEDVICRFSCVPVLTMDNGAEFQGEVQHLLRTLYRCTAIFSTPYHPEGNAPVERSHDTLTNCLFKVVFVIVDEFN